MLTRTSLFVLFFVAPLEVAANDLPSSDDRIPDVVYIPTPPDVVQAMLRLAKVKPQDVVCDLGCGDGRILVAAARDFGAHALGYDIDPLRVEAARKNAAQHDVDARVIIHRQDLFKADLRKVTVVTLYLNSRYNARLIPQLKQLPDGARVVSHMFRIPGLKVERVLRMTSKEDDRVHYLLLYKTPLVER